MTNQDKAREAAIQHEVDRGYSAACRSNMDLFRNGLERGFDAAHTHFTEQAKAYEDALGHYADPEWLGHFGGTRLAAAVLARFNAKGE